MVEILMVLAVFGYIYYLRNYADLRSRSEKEDENVKEGIKLFKDNEIQSAFDFFDKRIKARSNSAVSYLYRALCYKEMGNRTAAMKDLNAGLSYDDSVFGLHLEKGKLLISDENYTAALASLDKAVFNAGEQSAESYYWRGMTKQHLHKDHEAEKDFEKEMAILQASKNVLAGEKPNALPLIDRRLIANSILVIFTSVMLIVIIKNADSIHLPYLMAVLASISIGFVEPHRGWLLALMQCIMMLTGYFLFTKIPISGGRIELENFSLYGSLLLTFVGSFLGAFLKKAINQG